MRKRASILTPILSVLFALAAIGIGGIASAGTALAKTPSSQHHFRIKMPMKIVSITGAEGVPNVTGNCGDINIDVSDLGNGDARFSEEVSSSQGFIFSLSYTVVWANHSKGTSNSVGGSFLYPSNPWRHTDTQYTQPGLVTAVITAKDHVGGIPPFGKDCSGTANGADQIS